MIVKHTVTQGSENVLAFALVFALQIMLSFETSSSLRDGSTWIHSLSVDQPSMVRDDSNGCIAGGVPSVVPSAGANSAPRVLFARDPADGTSTVGR